jgi:hypothetical protein
MTSRFFLSILFLSSIIILLFNACVKNKALPVLKDEGTCDTTLAYYENDILPILANNCALSGCHDAVTAAEGLNLSNYSTLLKYLNKEDKYTNSDILKVIKDNGNKRMPPLPMSALTAKQINKLESWLAAGAKYNKCLAGGLPGNTCDTVSISFANDIQPLLNDNCVTCHNSISSAAGFDLSNYAGAVNAASFANFLPDINYTGPKPMPPGTKMPQCNIDKIQQWININKPNN